MTDIKQGPQEHSHEDKTLELWMSQHEIYTKVTQAYDKTIVTLSSSGLAFSTGILPFIGEPRSVFALWLIAVFSIFLSLTLTLFAQSKGARIAHILLLELGGSNEKGKGEEQLLILEKNKLSEQISKLEPSAIRLFLVGVIALLLFISSNMW